MSDALWRGVWPAVWPAIPVALVLLAARSYVPPRLSVIALFAAAGVLLYFALFVAFALGTKDRALYLRKARQLVWRASPAVAA